MGPSWGMGMGQSWSWVRNKRIGLVTVRVDTKPMDTQDGSSRELSPLKLKWLIRKKITRVCLIQYSITLGVQTVHVSSDNECEVRVYEVAKRILYPKHTTVSYFGDYRLEQLKSQNCNATQVFMFKATV